MRDKQLKEKDSKYWELWVWFMVVSGVLGIQLVLGSCWIAYYYYKKRKITKLVPSESDPSRDIDTDIEVNGRSKSTI